MHIFINTKTFSSVCLPSLSGLSPGYNKTTLAMYSLTTGNIS